MFSRDLELRCSSISRDFALGRDAYKFAVSGESAWVFDSARRTLSNHSFVSSSSTAEANSVPFNEDVMLMKIHSVQANLPSEIMRMIQGDDIDGDSEVELCIMVTGGYELLIVTKTFQMVARIPLGGVSIANAICGRDGRVCLLGASNVAFFLNLEEILDILVQYHENKEVFGDPGVLFRVDFPYQAKINSIGWYGGISPGTIRHALRSGSEYREMPQDMSIVGVGSTPTVSRYDISSAMVLESMSMNLAKKGGIATTMFKWWGSKQRLGENGGFVEKEEGSPADVNTKNGGNGIALQHTAEGDGGHSPLSFTPKATVSFQEAGRVGVDVKLEKVVWDDSRMSVGLVSDNHGRILIMDIGEMLVVKVLKGYRNAEYAFLPADPCSFILINIPQQGVVEIVHPPFGEKIACIKTPRKTRLLGIFPSFALFANAGMNIFSVTFDVSRSSKGSDPSFSGHETESYSRLLEVLRMYIEMKPKGQTLLLSNIELEIVRLTSHLDSPETIERASNAVVHLPAGPQIEILKRMISNLNIIGNAEGLSLILQKRLGRIEAFASLESTSKNWESLKKATSSRSTLHSNSDGYTFSLGELISFDASSRHEKRKNVKIMPVCLSLVDFFSVIGKKRLADIKTETLVSLGRFIFQGLLLSPDRAKVAVLDKLEKLSLVDSDIAILFASWLCATPSAAILDIHVTNDRDSLSSFVLMNNSAVFTSTLLDIIAISSTCLTQGLILSRLVLLRGFKGDDPRMLEWQGLSDALSDVQCISSLISANVPLTVEMAASDIRCTIPRMLSQLEVGGVSTDVSQAREDILSKFGRTVSRRLIDAYSVFETCLNAVNHPADDELIHDAFDRFLSYTAYESSEDGGGAREDTILHACLSILVLDKALKGIIVTLSSIFLMQYPRHSDESVWLSKDVYVPRTNILSLLSVLGQFLKQMKTVFSQYSKDNIWNTRNPEEVTPQLLARDYPTLLAVFQYPSSILRYSTSECDPMLDLMLDGALAHWEEGLPLLVSSALLLLKGIEIAVSFKFDMIVSIDFSNLFPELGEFLFNEVSEGENGMKRDAKRNGDTARARFVKYMIEHLIPNRREKATEGVDGDLLTLLNGVFKYAEDLGVDSDIYITDAAIRLFRCQRAEYDSVAYQLVKNSIRGSKIKSETALHTIIPLLFTRSQIIYDKMSAFPEILNLLGEREEQIYSSPISVEKAARHAEGVTVDVGFVEGVQKLLSFTLELEFSAPQTLSKGESALLDTLRTTTEIFSKFKHWISEEKDNVFFRERIALSTLSRKRIQIARIRVDTGGIRDYEVEFIKLVSELCNGSEVHIDVTGTSVSYAPGVLHGAEYIEFHCGGEKDISYFLYPLLYILPFVRKDTTLTFTGITNGNSEFSVDSLRLIAIPLMNEILSPYGFNAMLKLKKREVYSSKDCADGKIVLTVKPLSKHIEQILLVDEGRVKMIRGVCYGNNVSPALLRKTIFSARGVFNNYIPDVRISLDNCTNKRKKDGGDSHGYGIMVFSESTVKRRKFSELMADEDSYPEEIGKAVAKSLISEIAKRGCVPQQLQSLMSVLILASDGNISKFITGKLTSDTVSFLRHIKEFLGVTYKLQDNREESTVSVSCTGIGKQFHIVKSISY